jgi:hypothetical protein
MDTYYCPNVKCSYGIGLAEIYTSARQCSKCGTQTRKLSFLDVMKLVEEKKGYQSNPEPIVEETVTNEEPVANEEPITNEEPNQRLRELLEQIRPFPEEAEGPIQEPVEEHATEQVPETVLDRVEDQEPPVSMNSTIEETSVPAKMSDEQLREDIDNCLEKLARDEYVPQAAQETDIGLEDSTSIISHGFRVLIEQKKVMIKQNELILRNLGKLQQN